jgi:hypothetical protein
MRKIPEDASSMSDRNSAKYLPDYTALRHRKQQTLGTEVSGPGFTPDSLVSLAISRYLVECECELRLPFSPAEA